MIKKTISSNTPVLFGRKDLQDVEYMTKAQVKALMSQDINNNGIYLPINTFTVFKSKTEKAPQLYTLSFNINGEKRDIFFSVDEGKYRLWLRPQTRKKETRDKPPFQAQKQNHPSLQSLLASACEANYNRIKDLLSQNTEDIRIINLKKLSAEQLTKIIANFSNRSKLDIFEFELVRQDNVENYLDILLTLQAHSINLDDPENNPTINTLKKNVLSFLEENKDAYADSIRRFLEVSKQDGGCIRTQPLQQKVLKLFYDIVFENLEGGDTLHQRLLENTPPHLIDIKTFLNKIDTIDESDRDILEYFYKTDLEEFSKALYKEFAANVIGLNEETLLHFMPDSMPARPRSFDACLETKEGHPITTRLALDLYAIKQFGETKDNITGTLFNYSTKCGKSHARLPKRALESAYEYYKKGNRTAALTIIKMLSEQTKKKGDPGINKFYKKAIAVIKDQNQFSIPADQHNEIPVDKHNVNIMFGDLFSDLKEEYLKEKRAAISDLEFEYDQRPTYDRSDSSRNIRLEIEKITPKQENTYNLICTKAAKGNDALKQLCFELGNKVYEHFKTSGDTWKNLLTQIRLGLSQAHTESITKENKKHLEAMLLDFTLLKAILTKYEALPEQLLTRENTYKEISLEYCDQLLDKCESDDQRTAVNELKTKITAQFKPENEVEIKQFRLNPFNTKQSLDTLSKMVARYSQDFSATAVDEILALEKELFPEEATKYDDKTFRKEFEAMFGRRAGHKYKEKVSDGGEDAKSAAQLPEVTINPNGLISGSSYDRISLTVGALGVVTQEMSAGGAMQQPNHSMRSATVSGHFLRQETLDAMTEAEKTSYDTDTQRRVTEISSMITPNDHDEILHYLGIDKPAESYDFGGLINSTLFRGKETNIAVYKKLLTLSRALSIIEEEAKYTPDKKPINIMRASMLRPSIFENEIKMLRDEEAVWDILFGKTLIIKGQKRTANVLYFSHPQNKFTAISSVNDRIVNQINEKALKRAKNFGIKIPKPSSLKASVSFNSLAKSPEKLDLIFRIAIDKNWTVMTHCKSGMDRTSVGDARRYALQKLRTTWKKINDDENLEQVFIKEVYNYLLTVCPYFQLGRGIAATKDGVRSGDAFTRTWLFGSTANAFNLFKVATLGGKLAKA